MKILDKLEYAVSEEIPLGAKDAPDSRDWGVTQLFGNTLPKDRFTGDVDMTNMYAMGQKGNECTAYSLTGSIQTKLKIGPSYNNKKDNLLSILDVDPLLQWENQKIKITGSTSGTADDSYGDTLQNALKTASNFGVRFLIGDRLITVKIKYASINNSEVKTWLRKGYPVYTGSKWLLKRNKAGKLTSFDDNGYLWASGVDTGGHCFFLNGIKNGEVQMMNSHGEKWGDRKGCALLSDKKLASCFSKYIVEIDWVDLYKQLNA